MRDPKNLILADDQLLVSQRMQSRLTAGALPVACVSLLVGAAPASAYKPGVVEVPITSTDTVTPVGVANDGQDRAAVLYAMGAFGTGALLGIENLSVGRMDSDGIIDKTFGNSGFSPIVTKKQQMPAGIDAASDGRLAVTFHTEVGAPTGVPTGTLNLTQLTNKGAIDTTFGTSGTAKETGSFPMCKATPGYLASGKLIVGGCTATGGPSGHSATQVAYRYSSNGSRDSSYGTAGKGSGATSAGTYFMASDIKEADGSLTSAGNRIALQTPQVGKAALMGSNGQAATFGTAGVTTFQYGDHTHTYDVNFAADGGIITASLAVNQATTTGGARTTENEIVLSKFKTNGTLDSNFGTAGTVKIKIGKGPDSDYSFPRIDVLPSGKIFVAWSIAKTSTNAADKRDVIVQQLNSNGTVDSGFNGGKQLPVDFNTSNDNLIDLVHDSKGRPLMLGATSNENGVTIKTVLVRFTATGADSSYGVRSPVVEPPKPPVVIPSVSSISLSRAEIFKTSKRPRRTTLKFSLGGGATDATISLQKKRSNGRWGIVRRTTVNQTTVKKIYKATGFKGGTYRFVVVPKKADGTRGASRSATVTVAK